MKYLVKVAARIRSTPEILSTNILGVRKVGDIVIPMDTIGDKIRSRSYWVMDKHGWTAAQWYGEEYLEPFI